MLSRTLKYGLFIAASVIGLSGTVTAAEPIVIRFAHVVSDDTPKGRGALLFKKLVEERLSDQVKVDVYSNSSLVGDTDELQALLDGRVQMLAPSLSSFDSYTKKLQVFDLPFLFEDVAAVERFQGRQMSIELMNSMAPQGIHGLAYWNTGLKQFSATRPLYLPTDAKGLSFRVQDSSLLEDQFVLMDANSKRLPFSQLADALRQKQVQGAENTWSIIASERLSEAQPYVTESNHGTLSYLVVSSSQFWNSLPFAVRSELENIIAEVTQHVNAESAQLNRRARDQLQADGTRIISLTDEQRDQWRERMRPLWEQYEAEIGSDVIRAAISANRRR